MVAVGVVVGVVVAVGVAIAVAVAVGVVLAVVVAVAEGSVLAIGSVRMGMIKTDAVYFFPVHYCLVNCKDNFICRVSRSCVIM